MAQAPGSWATGLSPASLVLEGCLSGGFAGLWAELAHS